MINDYKRWLLLEISDPSVAPSEQVMVDDPAAAKSKRIRNKGKKSGPKATALAMTRVAQIRRFELLKLAREYPYVEK